MKKFNLSITEYELNILAQLLDTQIINNRNFYGFWEETDQEIASALLKRIEKMENLQTRLIKSLYI